MRFGNGVLNRRIAFARRALKFNATQAEVAQLMLQQRALFFAKRGRVFGERFVALKQSAIKSEFGVELRDFWQRCVVSIAQFGAADHGVQVRHSAPGTAQSFCCVLQRLDDGLPRYGF